MDAAYLLANHFQCTIEFLVPIDDYKRKTPDFKMLGIEWELKSPYSLAKTKKLLLFSNKHVIIPL